MIDRMFIQEEKTMLALDKQLAKEKPGGTPALWVVCSPTLRSRALPPLPRLAGRSVRPAALGAGRRRDEKG